MPKISIPKAAQEWLIHGERGISSEAIFSRLTGLELGGGWFTDHPSDPSDLMRCRRLLESVPEFAARFGEMAGRSLVWKRLVKKWPGLCRLMDQEVPGWRDGTGSAPKTYRRMKDLGC